MQALLFDLDGVIYQDGQLIEGADRTLAWVSSQSLPFLFVTNTTSRPRSAIIERLQGFGIQTTADSILTPPRASCEWLHQQQLSRLALFVPEATRAEFADFEHVEADAEADAVIIGDLGERWDYPLLNQAFRHLQNNPRCQLIALGMTRYWRAEDGLRLDTGPFVKALEFATDRHPIVMGKPAEAFFQAAIGKLQQPAEAVLMVGDDIRADIGGAQEAGLKTVLVKTGKFKPADLDSDIRPDAVLGSIAELPDAWQQLT